MTIEILGKLFGSPSRVRVMRLFLFNPDVVCSVNEIARRIRADAAETARETRVLAQIGLVKQRLVTETTITERRGKKPIVRRKRVKGYALDRLFPYLIPLQNLLVNSALVKSREIVRQLSRGGNLKLVVVAGVFIQDQDSRLDLLVVGDHMKKGSIARSIKAMEADIGKELRYAILETSDFRYREDIGDKLVRDVLDYQHQILLDKLRAVPAE